MSSPLDPAFDWAAWRTVALPSQAVAPGMKAPSAHTPAPRKVEKTPAHYAAWQLTPERQRHEWKCARRAIISIRIKLLVYGHLFFFAVCLGLRLLNFKINHELTLAGCYSLLVTSIGLLVFEGLHVRFQPRHPPRFIVRPSGVTEYGDEGPLNHWDWARVRQVRLEADRDRPDFRSLVLVSSGIRCLQSFQRIHIPLPEAEPAEGAAISESAAIAAIGLALTENGFQWKPHVSRNDVRIEKV